MVKNSLHLFLLSFLLILGACASKMKDQMRDYRDTYAKGDYSAALAALKKSELKEDKKSSLLWHLEKGTVHLADGDEDKAILEFQRAIELIDLLYTKKISAKVATVLINDASDVFYGASYERSYAHYFLAKSYYSRYLKKQNKLDLQGARGTILAWDTYFTELQRSAAPKTIYQTDLMMKVFGAEVHEVSEIRNDKQIALQLYKDALNILDTMGGAFASFNAKATDYIKAYEAALAEGKKPSGKEYVKTANYQDLKNFLHYKILALTKEIRGFDYNVQLKALKPDPSVLKKLKEPKGNVVVLLEEGLIPQKVGKQFNFGLKGAVDAVDNPGAKQFIATVGAEVLTMFAMNTLGMRPEHFAGAGSFIFAHDVTKVAVSEAAISFQLPMIEESPKLKDFDIVVLDEKGEVLKREPLALISENGEIAKVVLEEDVVARYWKTGSRVAVRHLLAIVSAMGVYNSLKSKGDFIAKAAAMATYVGASKGIAALEKADTRHWTTLPQAFRMMELSLKPGTYQLALAPKDGKDDFKTLGNIQVAESGKAIHSFKLINP